MMRRARVTPGYPSPFTSMASWKVLPPNRVKPSFCREARSGRGSRSAHGTRFNKETAQAVRGDLLTKSTSAASAIAVALFGPLSIPSTVRSEPRCA